MSPILFRRAFVLSAFVLLAFLMGWWGGRRAGRFDATRRDGSEDLRNSGGRAASGSVADASFEESDDMDRLARSERIGLQNPAEALAELRFIEPSSSVWLQAARLAAVYNLQLGRDYDARPSLEALAELDPQDAGVHQALAEIAFRAEDFERALAEARLARRLAPESAELVLLIADCLDNLGRTEDMIEPLGHALRIDPALLPAHLNLAYALERNGRSEDALPHVERYLADVPESVQGHKVLALIRRSQNRSEDALAAIRKGRSKDESNVALAILEAEILLDLARPDEAYELLAAFEAGWGYEARFAEVFLAAAKGARPAEAERLERRWKSVVTTASLSSSEPESSRAGPGTRDASRVAPRRPEGTPSE